MNYIKVKCITGLDHYKMEVNQLVCPPQKGDLVECSLYGIERFLKITAIRHKQDGVGPYIELYLDQP